MAKSWYKVAKEKQINFKENFLGLTESGTYGKDKISYKNILSDEDAATGANFYTYNKTNEWISLQNWANEDRRRKVNFFNSGLKNMLRSEHIPYNLFYPLEKLRKEQPNKLNEFLEYLFDKKIKVDKVTRIKIEFASDLDKNELLNDNTSFDAYIEYLDKDALCGLGIEVKYTEKSYPYGDSEKTNMLNDNSEYNKLTRNSGYYKPNSHLKLREKKLKQPWRNHLLGIKLLELHKIQKFTSVHIYPEGNTYQEDVCKEYTACLSDDHKDSFIPITFEKFINTAENIFTSNDWITYLKNRY
jgi:hypothetical protein